MDNPEKPANELQRLRALYALNILDTHPEERFDRITRLAAHIFGCAHASITLVDSDRQWFKSNNGLQLTQTPREISFCAQTILTNKVLVITDTHKHPNFKSNPLVTSEPHIRFYAGVPLQVDQAYNVGSLCLLDSKPRSISDAEIAILVDLAKMVEAELQAQDVQQLTKSLLKTQQQLHNNKKLSQLRNHILELIVNSTAMAPILNTIVKSVEAEYNKILCSINLLDASGQHLMIEAAPSLPDFFKEAINGHKIGNGVGLWGTTAFTGERLFVEDIMTHPYSAEWKTLAAKANLRSCWSEPIRNTAGAVIGTIAIYQREPAIPDEYDIRIIEQFAHLTSIAIERQKSRDLIWRQANFDELTGLPNRNIMGEHLKRALSMAHRDHRKVALMFLDLDNFKDINDTLGHSVGDDLLVECAKRIQQSVREKDTVARMGGDEFVIIVTDIHDFKGLEHTAQKILKILTKPYHLQNEVVHSSASIGITLYPDDAQDVSSLLKNADQAMYGAKSIGKNNYQYYTSSMRATALERMSMINDLRHAIEHQELFMVYQPIVDLRTGQIYKAESLIRWQHPTRGLVGPMEFIPLAEETGLIIDISNWVFEQVSTKVNNWRNTLCPTLQISINTSPVHYTDTERCITQWLDFMLTSMTPPGAILLEITESLLMDSNQTVANKLFQFRQAGVEIALDDFGTGFSSISYLKKYPTDYLKIDKSFVHSMTQSSNDKVLCEAIIVMAKKLGIKVIAEGVETTEQHTILKRMGCDFVQGYLLSHPLSADPFGQLLQRNESTLTL